MAGELAGPDHVPALLDLLRAAEASEDLDAAEQALVALYAKADTPESSTAELIEAWADAAAPQRSVLLNVLASIGSANALRAVRAALADPDTTVRAAAIRALSNWKTADAAPDLLALATDAESQTDRVLGLRGYLNLAAQADLRPGQRLSMCREAAKLVQRDEERRLLVSTLGGVNSPEAVALLAPFLENPGATAEASAAIVGIAERLLDGRGAAKAAPRLIEPLEQVVRANATPELTDKARALLRKAR
jgi:HEAT repeat protein